MEKFYVCQDSKCPGTEFDTYEEACEYLRDCRKKTNEYDEGFIEGPGCDREAYDYGRYDYPLSYTY